MNEDLEIRSMLRRAEVGSDAPSPSVPAATLAARAIQVRGGRRRRNRIASGAAVVMLLATAWIVMFVRQDRRVEARRAEQPKQAPVAMDVDALRRQIAALERLAAAHEQTAERLVALERVERLRASAGNAGDPQAALDLERYNAAMVLIHDGDDLWLHRREMRAAAETYRRVIALFPSTYWAGVAQERLAKIGAGEKSGMNQTRNIEKPAA
jgi:hypothetical protein